MLYVDIDTALISKLMLSYLFLLFKIINVNETTTKMQ